MLVQAQPTVPDSVISAVIAALVALAVAVVGQLAISSRERSARRYERRRSALLDVQDAALELRRQLRQYGELVRAHPGQPGVAASTAEQDFDTARSRLVVALSRVEDQRAVEAVVAWQAAASVSFISVLDVSASQEQARWEAMNQAVGRALQDLSGARKD